MIRVMHYSLVILGILIGYTPRTQAMFSKTFFHSISEGEEDKKGDKDEEEEVEIKFSKKDPITSKTSQENKENIFENGEIKKKENGEKKTKISFLNDYFDSKNTLIEKQKVLSEKKTTTINTTTTGSSQILEKKLFNNKKNENTILTSDSQEIGKKEKIEIEKDDDVLEFYAVFYHDRRDIDFSAWKKFVLENASNQEVYQKGEDKMTECIKAGYLIGTFTDKDVLNFGVFGASSLSRFLKPFSQLSLKLSFNGLTDNGIQHLVKHLPNIDTISLEGRSFASHSDFKENLNGVAKAALEFGTVGLAMCTLGVSALLLPSYTGDIINPVESGEKPMRNVIKAIATHCPHLKRISMYNWGSVPDSLIKALVDGCKSMEEVDFSQYELTENGLQVNDFSYCELTETALKYLCKWKNLKVLKLNSIKVTGDASSAAKYIANQCKKLTEFDFSGWLLDKNALQYIVKHTTNLKKFDLGRELSSAVTDAVISSLANNCPNLIKCNLEFCGKITNTAIDVLAAKCPNLEEIHLGGGGKITDQAINSLATYCFKLKKIHLGSIEISLSTLKKLAVNCKGLKKIMSYQDRVELPYQEENKIEFYLPAEMITQEVEEKVKEIKKMLPWLSIEVKKQLTAQEKFLLDLGDKIDELKELKEEKDEVEAEEKEEDYNKEKWLDGFYKDMDRSFENFDRKLKDKEENDKKWNEKCKKEDEEWHKRQEERSKAHEKWCKEN